MSFPVGFYEQACKQAYHVRRGKHSCPSLVLMSVLFLLLDTYVCVPFQMFTPELFLRRINGLFFLFHCSLRSSAWHPFSWPFSFLLLTLLAPTRYVTVARLVYANAPCTNSLVSSSIPTMPISPYVLLTGERGPQIWPYSLPTVLP